MSFSLVWLVLLLGVTGGQENLSGWVGIEKCKARWVGSLKRFSDIGCNKINRHFLKIIMNTFNNRLFITLFRVTLMTLEPEIFKTEKTHPSNHHTFAWKIKTTSPNRYENFENNQWKSSTIHAMIEMMEKYNLFKVGHRCLSQSFCPLRKKQQSVFRIEYKLTKLKVKYS